jgi:GntR family transcriptional regulator
MASRSAHRSNKSKPARGNGFPAQRTGRGVARYYLLYEQLSGALNDGSIPAGAALPSEPELVSRYRLSRTTVRRALARLEEEGRIIRRRGSGTFARQNRRPARLQLDLSSFFEAELPGLAAQTSLSLLRFESGSVPAQLRELLPELGSNATIIQRLHRFQGTPFALTTAYIPERAGQKIRRKTLQKAALLAVLDQIGARTTQTAYTTSAVAADEVAAKRLDVALGTPLLRTRAVLTDSQNQLNGVIESLCRPDRFNLRATMERSPGRGSNSQWRLKRGKPE